MYPVFYVPAGDVLPVFFNSFDKDDGSSITMTGLAVTDIEIYKDGSVTQRSSDAGYVLLDTDGIDFDAITGLHGFSIDTGDNTDAGFYTVGAWFTVVVSAITIDAVAVSFVACQFRLMAAEAVAAKPKVDVDAWLGTAAATPTVAGVPEVDLTHVAGSTTSVSTVASSIATLLAAIGALADAAADGAVTTTDTLVAYVKQIINDLEGAPGIVTWPAAAAAANGVSISESLRRIDAAIGTISDLGGGATVAANLADIEGQTDDIGTAGAGLTAVPWNAAWDAEVQSEATDALNAYDPPTRAELTSDVAGILAVLTGIVPISGTIGATGNSTTALHLDGIAWANDGPNSMLILVQDVSAGIYVSRWIEDFATAGDLATIATLPFTPEASVDKYWVLSPRADVTGGSGLDAAGVRAAVGLASANLDTQLGAIDDFLDTEVAAILSDTNAILVDTGTTLDARIPAALVGGRMDSSVGAVAANAITAAAIANGAIDAATFAAGAIDAASLAADASTEINTAVLAILGTPAGASMSADIAAIEAQTDDIGAAGAGLTALATQASVDAIDNFIDTEIGTLLTDVAAILVDTGTTLDDFIDTEVAAILSDTNAIKAITDLLTAAQAEPTGVPAANLSPLLKLGTLFMMARNQVTVTSTKKIFFDDGGAAEFEKDLSDDATTYTETELNAP